jgi:hypothetical protein
MPASVNLNPSVDFETVMILPQAQVSHLSQLLQGALFPNFNKIFEQELMIMGVPQLKDVLNVIHTEFACLA